MLAFSVINNGEKHMKKLLLCTVVLSLTASCSGMRKSGDQYTVHAEAFNIVGFQIPECDYAKANSMIPKGASVHTVSTTSNDWTSVIGVINKIVGFSETQISGSTK